ncbi:MAG: Lipid A core-O-antigen ligase-like protein enyme [Candidatus Woesebacteria bacterium GW2011_GWC2_33_12]|uniref:Lipid A core-O-antigen ligase-like protein enyme n=1 Tax=Candidatus Woesebacteria bacterium GW2011_GWB1_33_22 TaxID=1618566 RepID=A0A0F9ZJN3_9BACT|nr:MAG: Lipid A core-O-antigen ligase-like protein enyme [Candidatus Woesebacteria bacterium GW2011_GWC2_33_12]KKP41828.1 MAG: Lipid A core-O-antigen ligase-like protein enyme [Candidatus Woesebacteria bacterium GW2011_GWA2_33_20]KKP44314.1 MAG: Lipid A core-O-antigen ligase-like protein enyme [Candidatus Woesebacteria bacterium GW2011_GWB1_33_22]KKP46072.1 MAG: Lipid A core-O-antigen ligase-like protein enyme [Microgenomates group bacterium GW2011_GWC1_33_28]KKP49962.1 MAG: Lipid A core-O-anti
MLYLISLLSFLLPTQLGLHVNSLQTMVYGFRIDYLIPTLYLTDLIALLIILLGFRKIKFTKKNLVFSILYIGFVVANILHTTYYIPAIYKWLKVTETILLATVLIKNKKIDFFKNILKPLSYSMFIVCLLGISQYLNKGSVGGIFYWLGERTLRFNDPNVSPFPYSTFSHPNSFAGFLLVFGIFLIQFKNKFKLKYFLTLAILVFINLILTNSLNVYIAIVLLVILNFRSNLAFSFLAFDFSSRTFSHRLELISASWKMIKDNFLFGVGLNNFIPNLPKVTNSFLNAWELQPVHNIFLLVFSETGVIGFIVFSLLVLFSLSPISYPLIAILATGQMDHYWLTLQQNMLLFTYALALNFKWKKKI